MGHSRESLGLHLPVSLKLMYHSSYIHDLRKLPDISHLKNVGNKECKELVVIPGLGGLQSPQDYDYRIIHCLVQVLEGSRTSDYMGL